CCKNVLILYDDSTIVERCIRGKNICQQLVSQLAINRNPRLGIVTHSCFTLDGYQCTNTALSHILTGLHDCFYFLFQYFFLGSCASCKKVPTANLLQCPPQFRLE